MRAEGGEGESEPLFFHSQTHKTPEQGARLSILLSSLGGPLKMPCVDLWGRVMTIWKT
jgi:hypothetical protein